MLDNGSGCERRESFEHSSRCLANERPPPLGGGSSLRLHAARVLGGASANVPEECHPEDNAQRDQSPVSSGGESVAHLFVLPLSPLDSGSISLHVVCRKPSGRCSSMRMISTGVAFTLSTFLPLCGTTRDRDTMCLGLSPLGSLADDPGNRPDSDLSGDLALLADDLDRLNLRGAVSSVSRLSRLSEEATNLDRILGVIDREGNSLVVAREVIRERVGERGTPGPLALGDLGGVDLEHDVVPSVMGQSV